MRIMPYFTLRVFQPLNPSKISGLALMEEFRMDTNTAEEGKRQLTDWIDGRVLERERFYRFEGYAPFRGGRPHFVLNISFYLFEDGRLCPLRIWHRSEQASNQSGESDWLVDFNGIPGWSLVASIQPRWHQLAARSADAWTGQSWRDWYNRACWSLVPQARSNADLHLPLRVAC
jgi:hypothetical protein